MSVWVTVDWKQTHYKRSSVFISSLKATTPNASQDRKFYVNPIYSLPNFEKRDLRWSYECTPIP